MSVPAADPVPAAESDPGAAAAAGEPAHDDEVLRMRGVTVQRAGALLLDAVDWTVELDERWVVLGPNGAGKTTLLRLAAAEMHPTRGTLDLLGERMGRVDVFELRRRIGLASSSLAGRVPGQETVRDVVRSASFGVVGSWREQYDPEDDARADELLGALGVAELAGRTYGTLSSGERQRTLVARALMTDPEMLLLDEPATGLDLGAREDLIARLTALAADPAGPATVMVTHHVEEIPPGISHVLMLREGRVVAQGLLDDVMTSENLSATFATTLELVSRRRRFNAIARR